MSLTDRQLEVLDFIREYRESHPFAPTQREIAKQFKFSQAAAWSMLERLEAAGAIVREGRRRRNVRISV
jgi:repressor LexA